MKRIFIIHGWGGNPNEGWINWLKKELTKKGYKVEAPQMPNTDYPKINEWVSYLIDLVKEPDKNTFFIGHSIGCQTILRYLESIPKNSKVGGIILVAAWLNLTDETWDENYTEEIARSWIQTPIDFEKIKSHTNKIIIINSDDDPYVPITDAHTLKKKLNAEVIMLKNQGHVDEDELPEALEKLEEIISK